MLDINPSDRITAEQITEHDWLKKHLGQECDDSVHHTHSERIVDDLRNYNRMSLLKQTVQNIIVRQLAPEHVEAQKSIFQAHDKDCNGFMEKEELKHIAKTSNTTIPEEEIDRIIDQLDLDHNNKINYSEFLTATVDITQFLTESKVRAMFNTFDIQGSGQITKENIKDAFTKFGKELSDEELDEIMNEHDTDHSHTISLSEFQDIFGKEGRERPKLVRGKSRMEKKGSILEN